jgi:CPA2 family monovalent cation:H+ antiporter-2
VADTPQRPVLERSFAGLRDLFTAVFFVAIGMMIDLHLLGAIWWQIILVTLFVVVVRISAYTFGLLAAGQSEKLALEAGLSLTAIGEFSFIIAQMGVVAGVLPAQYQPLSVAVALLTAVVSPWLTVRAVPLAESIVGRRPALIGRLVEEYRGWLGWVDTKRSGNALWRLSRKRLLQIGVGLAFASGLLLFAAPLEQTVRALLGMDNFLPNLSRLVFWGAVGLVTLGVLVAVWRNISALAMMVAEATTAELSNTAVLRPVVEHGLKAGAGVLLFAWLTAVSPFHPRNWWVLLGVVAAAAGVITLLGRRLVHWHSEMEVRLSDSITEGRGAALVAQTPSGWDLGVEEVVLPAACASAGASIRDLGLRRRFGCTVVGIDRQGIGLTNLGPDTVLYPLDRVLLLGSRGQVAAARVVLETPAESDQGSALGTLALSRIRVPADSPHIGRSLAESAPARSSGVQIAGIQRGDRRILTPGGEERLAAADDLLVIGTPEQLRGFRRWLTGAH